MKIVDFLNKEKISESPKVDLQTEDTPAIEVNFDEINEEIKKLERLYAKFKDQDYLDEISVLKSKIEKAKEQEAVQIIAKDPSVKKFYSETLKMNFVMNKEHEKLIFDDGAVYSFKELYVLYNSEPKPTTKDIELLHTLKLFKGEFIDEYEENPYI